MEVTKDLKNIIQEAMKVAMRAQDKERLAVIRLILSEIKQQEVDKRITLAEEDVIDILAKMIKKRRESITHFESAHREDLIKKENFEITVINEFLPAQLSEADIGQHVKQAILEVNAASIKDMAKVMQLLRKKLLGRADLEQIGKSVKDLLLRM